MLTEEEVNLLQSWERHHIKGNFVLMKYTPDAAIFMRVEKDCEIELYAVKGMISSIADNMRRKLPVMLETVLLPYNDKIIYDSFLLPLSINFGNNMIEIFERDYNNKLNERGIVKSL